MILSFSVILKYSSFKVHIRQMSQYFIIGCAQVFTFIGQLEFFYEQAPDAMRSLLTTAALGNHLSTMQLGYIVTDVSSRHGKSFGCKMECVQEATGIH